jgi:3-oxoacyl-[acyl-carrier protein] reductase
VQRDPENRVAVVTGASRGIGRAIALELARRGAFVIVNYQRNAQEAGKTLAAIEADGGRGTIRQADVSNAGQIQAMFQEILKEHKRVDILVNNAGITRDELFLTMRKESWQDLIETDLTAVFHCSKAVIRSMVAARRGVIINIGSGSALSPRPGQVNYSSAKSGLIGFSRSLAREVAHKGVRVLVVAPGFTETEMAGAVSREAMEYSLSMIPMGRWGRPEELASVVGFMASDDAAYIVGQTIIVDGGRAAGEQDFGF